MSYVISLQSGFARLIEQARGWFRRSLRPRTGGPDDKQDDLYEIFLFGPHG
jgi:DNA-directed RNA polymerase specialized sigma24 family protein